MVKIFRTSKRNIERYKIEFRKEKRKQREFIVDIYILTIIYSLKEKAEERKNKERKLKFESGIEKIIDESNEPEEIEINYTNLHKLNFCGYLRNPTINVEEKRLEGICPLRGYYKNKKCNGTPHNTLNCKHYKRMARKTEDLSILDYIFNE